MEKYEIGFIELAIALAERCTPSKESIPKVGAVIAVNDVEIGRGMRGPGTLEDDEHAEWHALKTAKGHARLHEATLYTTLEPCTRGVRTKELECCTELILGHKLRKVFIGILDPNHGVTGKGVWQLQNSNVEVVLFPHDLAKRVHVINAPFIRSQQTLGANIISPKLNEPLKTYETNGYRPVRFECLNPPTDNNFLLAFHNGQWWPQPGPFRLVEKKVWEIDAHFGSYGEHVLHIVTASDLGKSLIAYYWKVVDHNKHRKERIRTKLSEEDVKLLGGDYLGIAMTGLPKGIRSEASVIVDIVRPVTA